VQLLDTSEPLAVDGVGDDARHTFGAPFGRGARRGRGVAWGGERSSERRGRTHTWSPVSHDIIAEMSDRGYNDRGYDPPPPDYANGGRDDGRGGHPPPRAPGSSVSGYRADGAPPPPGATHTTVTLNTDPTPGARVTEISLDLGYFRTLPGVIKIVQLVRVKPLKCPYDPNVLLSDLRHHLHGLLLAGDGLRVRNSTLLKKCNPHLAEFDFPYRNTRYGVGHNHFFLAVAVIAFIGTLLWTFFYFLQMRDSVRSYVPCSWLRLVWTKI